MALSYTDDEIDALVKERKRLPQDWEDRMRLKSKRGHDEQYLELTGDAGTRFRLILRQSRINRLDFSVILAVLVPRSTQVFSAPSLQRQKSRTHEPNRESGVLRLSHSLRVRALLGARGARRRVRSADGPVRDPTERARLPLRGRQRPRSAEGAR